MFWKQSGLQGKDIFNGASIVCNTWLITLLYSPLVIWVSTDREILVVMNFSCHMKSVPAMVWSTGIIVMLHSAGPKNYFKQL